MGAVGKVEIQVGAITGDAQAKLQSFAETGRSALQKFAEGVRIGFGIDVAQKFLAVLQQIPTRLQETVRTGVQFNATMEAAKNGIAGLLLQFQPGRFGDFNAALKGADSVIQAIKDKAKGQPLQPLIEAFQTATGVATAAGVPMQKQIELIVDIGRAAQAISLPQQQITQEVRAMFNGEINRNAQLSIALGLTNEMIEKAKQQGNLYELIEGKLRGINKAAAAGLSNFTSLQQQLTFTVQETLGRLMQPVFDTLKAGFANLLAIVRGREFQQQLEGVAGGINSVVKAGVALAEWGTRNIGVLADLFTALAVAIGAATAALTIFYARVALAPLAAVAEKLQVLAVLGASGLVSLKVALSSLAGVVGLIGAAFAGWELGKWMDQWDAFGLKIGAWVQLAYLEIFGGLEKIKSYLAGSFTWIEDTMAIMWQRLIILTQQSVLFIANQWNKVSPFKWDTAGMQVTLKQQELELEKMLRDRDEHLEQAVQQSADKLQAANNALGKAAFETQFGTAAGKGKKTSLAGGSGGSLIPNLSPEAKALIEEIDKAYRESFNTRRELLDLEYADQLQKINDTVKDFDAAENAKARLTAVYNQKRAILADQEEEDYLKRVEEALAKNREANAKSLQLMIQQSEDALRKQRDDLAVQQAKLEADFTRTDVEKKGERIRLLKQEIGLVDEQIDKFTKLRDAQKDDAARQTVDQQITGLSGEKRQLQIRLVGLTNAADPNSFGQQFTAKWVEMLNQIGTAAERSARAFMSVWNSAIDKITDGFTGMLTGSMAVGAAITQIWQGVVTDILREFVRMAVQWVFLETFKNTVFASGAAAREGIRGGETASEAAHSATRKGIHLGETIFHGIQMAVRFAAHLAAEIGMTAVSLLQSAIRLPAILIETGKWLIMAAIKAASAVADIPYVGPILAIAAIGAIIAAGAKAMGAFADGGIVEGPGGPKSDSVLARVSPGEAITKTSSVQYWGRDFFRAINQGAAGARDVQRMALAGMSRPLTSDAEAARAIGGGGAASGGGNVTVTPAPLHVAVLNNRQELLDVIASSAGKAIIVNAVDEARLKLGIGT